MWNLTVNCVPDNVLYNKIFMSLCIITHKKCGSFVKMNADFIVNEWGRILRYK